MKFPYTKLAGKLLPIITIELKGREWVSYDAYVDSGAGYSIFHSDVAEDLEIKLVEFHVKNDEELGFMRDRAVKIKANYKYTNLVYSNNFE